MDEVIVHLKGQQADEGEGDSNNSEEKRARQEEDEDGGECEGEENEGEDELNVDEEGRVVCVGNEKLNYNFRSFMNVFRGEKKELESVHESLRKDCQTVFTARDVGSKQYSSGDTFWIPASSNPSELSQLEALVLELFHFHSAPAKGDFDVLVSGAEWWTQCVRPIDDIGFHWDRDYSLEESGIALHPHIATVTYLGEKGGPTLVVQKKPGMAVTDSVLGPISSSPAFMLSRPRTGKHMSFDGRLLHAAPGKLAELWEGEDDGTRMTLLVNVWLNWKPRDAEKLAQEVRAKLTPLLGVGPQLSFVPSEPSQLLVGSDSKVKEEVYKFKAETPIELHIPFPVKQLRNYFAEVRNDPFTVIISYAEGITGVTIEEGASEEDEGDEGDEGNSEDHLNISEPEAKKSKKSNEVLWGTRIQ